MMHEYSGRLSLFHLDLYRLSGEEEVEDLGLTDYLYGEGVCVIEWPDRLGSLLPVQHLDIVLRYDAGVNRQATLSFHGPAWLKRKLRMAELLR